jgi:hypothetical protein
MFKLIDTLGYRAIMQATKFKFWAARKLVTFTLKNLFNPVFWIIVTILAIAYYVYVIL